MMRKFDWFTDSIYNDAVQYLLNNGLMDLTFLFQISKLTSIKNKVYELLKKNILCNLND